MMKTTKKAQTRKSRNVARRIRETYEPAPGQLQVQLRPEVAEARFANIVSATVQKDVVLLDFLCQRSSELHLVARVAVTARVTRELGEVIAKALKRLRQRND